MSLLESLNQSARACEGAAVALAHALRPSASPSTPPAAQLETYREAEALVITCHAVLEEVSPILPLLSPGAACVGKSPPLHVPSSRVTNGFDSIVTIVCTLFDATNNAILDVAGNRSRWLVSPLQATACFDKMVTHHGQLRALYGIIHLAAKIVRFADVSNTLFVDTDASGSHPELEPARWRAAIKMDDFYGRWFGFHYSPEMRKVLRVVNIARGSVNKSHSPDDSSPQVIKNVAMLGWGWIYSNMVFMNSLGLSISGVSRIGADESGTTLHSLRKFMNLIEEPLVAGVSGLVTVDIAVATVFEIPCPGAEGGLEPPDSRHHSQSLQDVLETVVDPVSVRLMSHKSRPIQLPAGKSKRVNSSSPDGNGPCISGESSIGKKNLAAIGGSRDITRKSSSAHCSHSEEASKVCSSSFESTPVGDESRRKECKTRTDDVYMPLNKKKSSSVDISSTVMDSSSLAGTIKSEISKLHSNVSSFLGLEEIKPARALIMHFHGGGFVSQSSSSHQVYLKEWCAEVQDAVLLSVDYKLAPEHRFPVALHECVYSYIWALQNASRLGTLAERVVFAGDSAGGNLAIATAMMATELGFRPPDGITVAYPALYINSAWSPSRLLSFFDPMLPLNVLELCLMSYIPEGEEGVKKNALLSPALASTEQLRSLPPVTMVCGSLDPLLDDAVLFAHRMKEAGRRQDVIKIYESMPHGFLNMIQVNDTAQAGMQFLASKIAEYLVVPLRKGGGKWNLSGMDSSLKDKSSVGEDYS